MEKMRIATRASIRITPDCLFVLLPEYAVISAPPRVISRKTSEWITHAHLSPRGNNDAQAGHVASSSAGATGRVADVDGERAGGGQPHSIEGCGRRAVAVDCGVRRAFGIGTDLNDARIDGVRSSHIALPGRVVDTDDPVRTKCTESAITLRGADQIEAHDRIPAHCFCSRKHQAVLNRLRCGSYLPVLSPLGERRCRQAKQYRENDDRDHHLDERHSDLKASGHEQLPSGLTAQQLLGLGLFHPERVMFDALAFD